MVIELRIYLLLASSCCGTFNFIMLIENPAKLIIYETWTNRLSSIHWVSVGPLPCTQVGETVFTLPSWKTPHITDLFPFLPHCSCCPVWHLWASTERQLCCYQLSCDRVNWEACLNHSRCRFTEKFISDYRPGLQPPKWEKPSANLNLSECSCLVAFIAGEDKVMIFYFYFTVSRQIH